MVNGKTLVLSQSLNFKISKLIQKGLTISEIKCLTGFETKKIENVSNYLMAQYDKETVINEKLKKTRAS